MVRQRVKSLLNDESGQTVVEYVVMIVVVVMLVTTIGKIFKDRLGTLATGRVVANLKNIFFGTGSRGTERLYSYTIR